jgi:minor extracellular serine protease Vpr
LPVLSRQLCMDAGHCLSKAAQPRLRYHAEAFDVLDDATADVVPGSATFNAWDNAITTGGLAAVAPGATDTSVTISVNSAEWAHTPAKGLMIVTLDNRAGTKEAQLIPVTPQP